VDRAGGHRHPITFLANRLAYLVKRCVACLRSIIQAAPEGIPLHPIDTNDHRPGAVVVRRGPLGWVQSVGQDVRLDRSCDQVKRNRQTRSERQAETAAVGVKILTSELLRTMRRSFLKFDGTCLWYNDLSVNI
jgi:hypothetical protein